MMSHSDGLPASRYCSCRGRRPGGRSAAAWTVLVCISNPGLAGELSLALAEVGFRVEVVDTVDELARRGDDTETTVVIVDDSVSTWL